MKFSNFWVIGLILSNIAIAETGDKITIETIRDPKRPWLWITKTKINGIDSKEAWKKNRPKNRNLRRNEPIEYFSNPIKFEGGLIKYHDKITDVSVFDSKGFLIKEAYKINGIEITPKELSRTEIRVVGEDGQVKYCPPMYKEASVLHSFNPKGWVSRDEYCRPLYCKKVTYEGHKEEIECWYGWAS